MPYKDRTKRNEYAKLYMRKLTAEKKMNIEPVRTNDQEGSAQAAPNTQKDGDAICQNATNNI